MGSRFVCQSDRLLFGKISLDDVDLMQELYGSDKIMKYVTGKARTREETLIRLRRNIEQYETHGFGLYTVYRKKDGTFIGRCGIEPVEKNGSIEGELAWMFNEESWGKGYGTEAAKCLIEFAFEKLKLPRLIANVEKGNRFSKKIIEHAGMDLIDDNETSLQYHLYRKDKSLKCKYRSATENDVEHCKNLLEKNKLPFDDFSLSKIACIIAEDEKGIIGLAGLEIHGNDGLFRSFVVADHYKGYGVGSKLLKMMKVFGEKKEIKAFYLLTETAKNYFLKYGFEKIDRDNAPIEIQKTSEFSSICPDSAIVLKSTIRGISKGSV